MHRPQRTSRRKASISIKAAPFLLYFCYQEHLAAFLLAHPLLLLLVLLLLFTSFGHPTIPTTSNITKEVSTQNGHRHLPMGGKHYCFHKITFVTSAGACKQARAIAALNVRKTLRQVAHRRCTHLRTHHRPHRHYQSLMTSSLKQIMRNASFRRQAIRQFGRHGLPCIGCQDFAAATWQERRGRQW